VRNQLKTESFTELNARLENALRLLPEDWEGAHDLYKTMLSVPMPKRIELVTNIDEPVAVVGLIPSWEAGSLVRGNQSPNGSFQGSCVRLSLIFLGGASKQRACRFELAGAT
jgi:hypothetical protein